MWLHEDKNLTHFSVCLKCGSMKRKIWHISQPVSKCGSMKKKIWYISQPVSKCGCMKIQIYENVQLSIRKKAGPLATLHKSCILHFPFDVPCLCLSRLKVKDATGKPPAVLLLFLLFLTSITLRQTRTSETSYQIHTPEQICPEWYSWIGLGKIKPKNTVHDRSQCQALRRRKSDLMKDCRHWGKPKPLAPWAFSSALHELHIIGISLSRDI